MSTQPSFFWVAQSFPFELQLSLLTDIVAGTHWLNEPKEGEPFVIYSAKRSNGTLSLQEKYKKANEDSRGGAIQSPQETKLPDK